MNRTIIKCKGCGIEPYEIQEYVDAACDEHDGALADFGVELTEANLLSESELRNACDEYVRHNEGTYNYGTNLFWCTLCYIKNGMPLGKA